MKVSGFSFVRNAVKFDYPFLESISSILPLCDEFVVAVGTSDDDTLERLRSFGSPKIRIIETVWDESERSGGKVLAQQTNIALEQVTGDWAFYLQADEVVHENDLPVIERAMKENLNRSHIEGLLFNYLHFYGSYAYVGASRRWYRREIRIIRNGIGARSWGDAQGFRIDNRKMRVKQIDASIYHYGWVKPPTVQMLKQQTFNRLWHDDGWVKEHVGSQAEFDYSNGGTLKPFRGTHPQVMRERVASQHWRFTYEPSRAKQSIKERLSDWFEARTQIRLGEYKNYILIDQ
jgi:glycosyltransferase involved in cell wall biosynthesis